MVLDDSSNVPISKDAIDSINHDVHLAFALLARRHNSQVPVNRLHPELLGMVFQHIRAPAEVFDPEKPLRKPIFGLYMPLVHAMMVCHKWYVVASEMASLWTDVDSSRRGDGPSCLLKRSGMTPIHLRLDISCLAEYNAYFHRVVRANAFRLRQLDLSTTIDGMQVAMQLMPLLRCLKMCHENYRENPVLRNAQGRFPSLRGMVLIGCLWRLAPEAARPLTKLTHLYISDIANDISIAKFTTMLDAMPMLEVLDLHRCLDVALTERPTRTTTLQHLTRLTIREMVTVVAEVLMSALVLPRATTVYYLWLGVPDYYNTPRITSAAILPQPPLWHDATSIRIIEDKDAHETLFIELEGDTHRVRLRLQYGEPEQWVLWPLPIPNLQLAHVSSAHLCIFYWTFLRQFLARVPTLVTLVVEVRGAGAAVRTARMMAEELRDVLLQDGPVLCPGLREIALISSAAMQDLTECLAPALKKRRRDGRQVERLRTWIHSADDEDNAAESTARDAGDALAEYIGAGEVEHENSAFWSRDGERWRRENEFGRCRGRGSDECTRW